MRTPCKLPLSGFKHLACPLQITCLLLGILVPQVENRWSKSFKSPTYNKPQIPIEIQFIFHSQFWIVMLYTNFNKEYMNLHYLLLIAVSSLEIFRLYFLPWGRCCCCCCCCCGRPPGFPPSAFASPREEGPASATAMGEGWDSDSTTMETSTKANITVRRSFIVVAENQINSEFEFC